MPTERHPEVDALLEELGELRAPPAHAQSPEGAREASNRLFIEYREGKPTPPVGGVHTVRVEGPNGGVPVRVYEPDDDGPHPALVYLHGGGWVRGSPDTYDEFCRHLVREVGCLALSVDYRRAPEHSFPAAVEDCYAAVEWAAEFADIYDGDPDRLAVAGDSAGGNLAAAVTLMARDLDGPGIDHQVLIYPVTNYAFDTDSYRENADDPVLPKASMEWYWDHYLDREIDGAHPYASPLRARDLSGLPPATVVTAGFDPLRDEGAAYADRLRAAGVDVVHEDYEDMIHVFVLFPEALERAREARGLIAERLAGAFSG